MMIKYCVGVVPIPYLSAIVPYMPDRGVVRGSDSSIDSYIVPLSCIGVDTVFGHVSMFGRVQAGRVGRRCFVYRVVADEGEIERD